MFKAQEAPAITPTQPPKTAPPAAQEGGEFTRMFQPPTVPARPPVEPPQAPPRAPQAGEFTQMFQTPGGASTSPTSVSGGSAFPPPLPQAPPPPPRAKSQEQPDEFARFFEAPAGPLPQSPAVRGPLTPQPGGSGPNRAGEFTRMFGPHDHTAGVPPPSANPAGGATQAFEAVRPAPPRAPQPQGPSEMTQMFSAPAQLTLGQSQPSAEPPAAPQGRPAGAPSRLPLILGLAAGAVLLLAVILFFVLRK